MFPCIMVCKHVPLRNSGGRLIRWPWVLFPPSLRCNVQGYDFRFTYAQLHPREFSKDTFRQCLFLSEVISLCPTRWKNLDYRIYLGTFPPSPLFLPFLVPLASSSPLLAFRLRLTVVFSTILRRTSGSFLLCFPLFHQRQILSLLLQREGSSVSWLCPFPSPNFPFQSPGMFLIPATLEIRVSSSY